STTLILSTISTVNSELTSFKSFLSNQLLILYLSVLRIKVTCLIEFSSERIHFVKELEGEWMCLFECPSLFIVQPHDQVASNLSICPTIFTSSHCCWFQFPFFQHLLHLEAGEIRLIYICELRVNFHSLNVK